MDAQTQSLIITIVVGIIAGWLAGQIVRGYGFGLIGNLIVGVVGALIATWGLAKLNMPLNIISNPTINSILVATIGAVVLLLLIGLVRRAA